MQLFIQMVYARDCNLNNNSVIRPETICAAAEWPSIPLLRRGYTSKEKLSTSSSCAFVDYLYFSVLCLVCLCVRLFICALWSPAGKGLTSSLSFVVSNCEFVTFPLASWVRCGYCIDSWNLHPYLLLLYQVIVSNFLWRSLNLRKQCRPIILQKDLFLGFQYTFRVKCSPYYHTGKCICRFAGIYAYCRYFIDRKW